MKEIVSIIIPTYNSEKYISVTINSIINQTYTNWECLITDDFSTDRTVEIVESYVKSDSRIKLFKLEKNSGAGIARNFSIDKAEGRYFSFCDSDDVWLPTKLEVQLKFLNEHKLSFTYSSYFIQNENQLIMGKVLAPRSIDYSEILKNNYIGCLTVIFDSQKLGKLFMPEISKRQDWVLWIEIIKKIKKVYGIQEPLAIYTVRGNSISRNKLGLIKFNWNVYHKALGFGIVKSFFYLIRFLYYYVKKKINY